MVNAINIEPTNFSDHHLVEINLIIINSVQRIELPEKAMALGGYDFPSEGVDESAINGELS